ADHPVADDGQSGNREDPPRWPHPGARDSQGQGQSEVRDEVAAPSPQRRLSVRTARRAPRRRKPDASRELEGLSRAIRTTSDPQDGDLRSRRESACRGREAEASRGQEGRDPPAGTGRVAGGGKRSEGSQKRKGKDRKQHQPPQEQKIRLQSPAGAQR